MAEDEAPKGTGAPDDRSIVGEPVSDTARMWAKAAEETFGPTQALARYTESARTLQGTLTTIITGVGILSLQNSSGTASTPTKVALVLGVCAIVVLLAPFAERSSVQAFNLTAVEQWFRRQIIGATRRMQFGFILTIASLVALAFGALAPAGDSTPYLSLSRTLGQNSKEVLKVSSKLSDLPDESHVTLTLIGKRSNGSEQALSTTSIEPGATKSVSIDRDIVVPVGFSRFLAKLEVQGAHEKVQVYELEK